MTEVAIAGGGITGLATAWFLRQSAPGVRITIYEAGDRLGGKLRTARLCGVTVEEGPDTFLARVPWAVDLCRQLGLSDELVEPATGKAYVWTRGRLRPLPDGTVLGVPYRLSPLARSGIVSVPGVARAALDVVLPRFRFGEDPTIASVVAARFGDEVAHRLVEPLLGGIHAGRADRLSLAAVAPQVAAAAARHRSLMLGLRASPRNAEGPVFLGLRGGMGRLVARLRECLDGVDIRLASPVDSVDGLAAAVVLAVPAFAAAPLLRPLSPAAAAGLDAIEHASVVTATLAYPDDAFPAPLDGSGFLVPRVDGRLMTACTWTSSKWPAASAPGTVLVRASAGRMADGRAMSLGQADLVDRLHGELVQAMGLRHRPRDVLVTRWLRAFPQYDSGHRARVAAIREALRRDAPRVVLAGAPYDGVGIASCIRSAQEAAAAAAALTSRLG